MFDDAFSFTSVRSSSCDSHHAVPISPTASSPALTARSASPCSSLPALPTSRPSVADLAAQFSRSRLRTESSICYDPCDAYANLDDDDAGWLVADSPTSDYHSASIRAGLAPRSAPHRSLRQSNARLLCSTAHRHDIAALVARMVHSQDQCAVAHTELHPSELALAADDEGYDSSEMDASSSPSSSSSSSASPSFSSSRRPSMALHRRAGLEYRRSSDLRCGAPCVSKMTRFRKDRNHVRRRTADK